MNRRPQRSGARLLASLALCSAILAATPASARTEGARISVEWAFPDEVVDHRAPANGCGSQGEGGINVPDQIGSVSFTESCDWHDRCYGTKGLPRSYCDRGMFARTLEACDSSLGCRGVAHLYYLGVAAFGGDPYLDGQQEACQREPALRHSRVHGDPHLLTLDGLHYAFMAAGEFTLLRDAHGTDLVQARFYPESDIFTTVTGVAVRLDERIVSVQVDPRSSAAAVYLDGEPVTRVMAVFEEGLVELGTAIPGVHQVVTVRGWDGLRVEALVYQGRMDLTVSLPQPRWGLVSGLLGNADGDETNDLVEAGGRLIGASELPSAVYEESFVSAHRVAPDRSLFVAEGSGFDYHGEDIGRYPVLIASVDTFERRLVRAAEERCRETGLEGALLRSCVFDVLVSGDPGYADSAARSAERALDITRPGARASSGAGDPRDRSPDSSSLVEAVERSDIGAVRALLDGGADVNAGRRSDDRTPLEAALLVADLEMARLLVARGADPDRFSGMQFTPLQMAASLDSLELVTLLVEAGADPNAEGGAGAVRGWTALHSATLSGASIEVVEYLLRAGADPDGGWPATSFGPLNGAALMGRTEIVRILLSAGADPRSAFPEGLEPALVIQDQELLELLGL